jgi:hypothetical protein
MSKNLTPVPQHTGDLTVPVGGDARTALSVEIPIQTLGDRAQLSKNRLDACEMYALYEISGTIADAAVVTLTELADNGGFELASNVITVPAAGVYLAAVHGNLSTTDATNPNFMGLRLQKAGANILSAGAFRYSATTSQVLRAPGTQLVEIADPATDVLRIVAAITAGNLVIDTTSRLSILRIK